MRARLAAVGMVALGLVAAQAPRQRTRFPGGDHPRARADWFLRMRQSRDGLSPAAHHYQAWRQAQRMPVVRPRRQLRAGAAAPAAGTAPPTVGGNWTELGPRPEMDPQFGAVGGRITAIAVDPSDATGNTVYLGAADGGLWLSTNATAAQPTFTPIGDNLPSLSIGAIALDTSTQPTTIYVGTGEGNGSEDSYYGVGILKSTDGGQTWSQGTGVNFFGSAITRLLVDPNNTKILLASVTESGVYVSDNYVSSAPAIGIVRSSDSGATWTQVYNQTATATDLVYEPVSPVSGNFFAAIRGKGIFKSTDLGATWSAVAGEPLGVASNSTDFYRVSLATRPGVLYALISDVNGDSTQTADCGGAATCTGLAKSSDGGANWTSLTPPPTLYGSNHQGYYDQDIAAPPNSSVLVAGGVDEWSENLGAAPPTWTNLTNSYTTGTVHMDEHAIVCLDATHWYVGNDGGAWYTTDAGANWSNLNGTLGAIQFYSVTPDPATAGRMLGGSQDNGTALASPGQRAWPEILGGDGGHTAINPTNPQQMFTEFTGISLQRSDDGGASFHPVVDSGTIADTGEFYIPYALTADGSLGYLATQRVWRGPTVPTSTGMGWTAISLDLTHSQGSVTSDDLTAIAVAPSSADTVYAGAYDGSLSATSNATSTQPMPTWTEVQAGNLIFAGPVSAIAVSPADAQTVYWGLGFLGKTAALFKSSDGGKTSSDIAGDLPGSPINAIVVDPNNANDIYVATDEGVFAAGDGGGGGANEQWARVGSNLPAAAVLSLALTDAGGTPTLVAGTHGRGAWSIPAVAPAGFSMAATPSAQTVEAGQPAVYTIQTTATGGSSTITLSCGSEPHCTIAPATLAAGGTATVTVTPAPTGAVAATSFVVTGSNGLAAQAVTLGLTVLDYQFSWLASSGPSLAAQLELGQSGFYQATLASPGFDAPVSFSCPNAPSGVSCSFSPASVASPTIGTFVDLTVQAGSGAAPGAVALDVRAVGGSDTHDLTLNLMLAPFALAAAPGMVNAVVGTAATFTVSSSSATNFAGAIALSCSSPGAAQPTCAFNPPTIAAGGSSTATVTGFAGMSGPAYGGNLQDAVVFSGTAGAGQSQAQALIVPGDFLLAPSAIAPAIVGASTLTATVQVYETGLLAQPVALSCASSAGLTCSFNPAALSAQAMGTSTVTISGLQSVPASASIPLTLIGTSGGLQRAVALSLANDADFSMATALAPAAILPGDSASFLLLVQPVNGFAGFIALSCGAGTVCPYVNPFVPVAGGDTVALTASGLPATAPASVTVTASTTQGGATLSHALVVPVALGDFSMSATPAAQTVTAGTTAMVNLAFQATAGLAAAVSVTCSGLPAGALCTALTPNITNGTTAIVHIATPTVAAAPGGGGGGWCGWLVLLACLLVLTAALPRRRPAWALSAFLLASVACGGGGGGTIPSGGGGGTTHPPTTSTITITATDATPGLAQPTSHAVTVQLTIE
ncbi:MAG TPA: sialidase family protein [Terriglobales bacterium]|nr:sialidase family protein [Terriglobales bacterium]